MAVYRAEAVILRKLNFGEADRIMTLFTLERGDLWIERRTGIGHVEIHCRLLGRGNLPRAAAQRQQPDNGESRPHDSEFPQNEGRLLHTNSG